MRSLKRNNINNDFSFSQQKSSVFFFSFGTPKILFSFQNKTLIMSTHLIYFFICLMYRKIKWVVYVYLHKHCQRWNCWTWPEKIVLSKWYFVRMSTSCTVFDKNVSKMTSPSERITISNLFFFILIPSRERTFLRSFNFCWNSGWRAQSKVWLAMKKYANHTFPLSGEQLILKVQCGKSTRLKDCYFFPRSCDQFLFVKNWPNTCQFSSVNSKK